MRFLIVLLLVGCTTPKLETYNDKGEVIGQTTENIQIISSVDEAMDKCLEWHEANVEAPITAVSCTGSDIAIVACSISQVAIAFAREFSTQEPKDSCPAAQVAMAYYEYLGLVSSNRHATARSYGTALISMTPWLAVAHLAKNAGTNNTTIVNGKAGAAGGNGNGDSIVSDDPIMGDGNTIIIHNGSPNSQTAGNDQNQTLTGKSQSQVVGQSAQGNQALGDTYDPTVIDDQNGTITITDTTEQSLF